MDSCDRTNPSSLKAQCYRTARLTPEALEVTSYRGNDGYVVVEFFRTAYNHPFHAEENLYSVYADAAKQHLIGHFFERALTNFCLESK